MVSVLVYKDGTYVYSSSDTIAALTVNAIDSVIRFPPFLPPAKGNYQCNFSATIPVDSNIADNLQSVLFTVTDTTWKINQGPVTRNYYLYNTWPFPASYFRGTRFDVPPNSVGDTLSGFGVEFSPLSVPTTGTATVSVQLYSITRTATSWTYVGSSIARPVTAADISLISTPVWAYFRIDPVKPGGITPFILQPGTTYAAVVQTNNVTTNLLLDATDAPTGGAFTGFFGQYDTSHNDGGYSFNPPVGNGLAGAVPKVQLYFSNNPVENTSVPGVTPSLIPGIAYPDPANALVNIPYTLPAGGSVKITLYNILCQAIETQIMDVSGGKPMVATFSTTTLPDGVYIYNIAANGQTVNGRIVVAH